MIKPKRVVTLGEVMMRLSAADSRRLIQSSRFNVTYGGGEANVAAALSDYGLNAAFVSKVPDNALGQSAINHLRRYGVDTSYVIRGGERLGIYFLEIGASMRASRVIYDRADSSISDADISGFDFDKIFEDTDWFHITGIMPALSAKAAALSEAALKAAKEKGITTSMDLNYRRQLWSVQEAKEVMTGLFRYVDVCIGADNTLGFIPKRSSLPIGKFDMETHKDMFLYMKEEFGFRYVVSTIRKSISASDNLLSALVYDGHEFYDTKKYTIRIVDRVGGGDAFAGGFIYGLVSGMAVKDAAEFGVAASAIKHTIPGDFNHTTVEDIMKLIAGDGSGRVGW